MRNFWIETCIDGRKHLLRGGPRRRDGGFTLNIHQKEMGKSINIPQPGISAIGGVGRVVPSEEVKPGGGSFTLPIE